MLLAILASYGYLSVPVMHIDYRPIDTWLCTGANGITASFSSPVPSVCRSCFLESDLPILERDYYRPVTRLSRYVVRRDFDELVALEFHF